MKFNKNIKGYTFKFKSYGSGVVCSVYKEITIKAFFIKFKFNKKVWENLSVTMKLQTAKPNDLSDLAYGSVIQYEEYKKAWEEWRAKK